MQNQLAFDRHDLTDAQLLAECRWDHFRGPGPGGQKRNKTSSSARVTHLPTGLAAVAGESRSQARNKAAALLRLRYRLALELRNIAPGEAFSLPQWLQELIVSRKGLNCSRREEHYFRVLAITLDSLFTRQGSVSTAARDLGVTTANLVRFLQADNDVLTLVNRWRAESKLRPLGGSQRR